MSTITIDLATAKSIASLINIASSDKVIPVLNQVRVFMSTDYLISAVSTDRYTCITGSWEVDLTGADMPEFGISHAMAKFIAGLKVNSKFGNRYVTFEVNESSVIASSEGEVFTNDHITGQYPEVMTLMNAWRPSTDATPVTLSITLLSRLTKVVDRLGKKVENWTIDLGNSDRPAKPAPIRISAGNFLAIQQPRLAR